MSLHVIDLPVKEIPSRALLNMKAACKYLGKSRDKIRQLTDTGELKASVELDTAGRRHRVFKIEDLDAYRNGLPDWLESSGGKPGSQEGEDNGYL